MSVTSEQVCAYLTAYLEQYRRDYAEATAPPPRGGGYPPMTISPFLGASELICWLAADGYALAELTDGPPYRWEIAGGPALVTDVPDSRVPEWWTELLQREGILGKPIGLYRVVAKHGIPEAVWRGEMPEAIDECKVEVGATTVVVRHVDLPWLDLVSRLTYGAFPLILDPHLPTRSDPFWRPRVIRNLGFVPADRNGKRFFGYMELSPHVDEAAWDPRTIPARVRVDVRRDFAQTFAGEGQHGGTLEFGDGPGWGARFTGLLATLTASTKSLRELLESAADVYEAEVHDLLHANPVLVDVYGEVTSKPKFTYPPGESPLGKEYVEPDFLVRYPDDTYRLIEIERPGKRVATVRGEPRAEVGQAAFQIAEWRTYIQKHYDQLRDRFPGISTGLRTTLVISRDISQSFGAGRSIRAYKELLRNQFAVDDVYTYDDLLKRAEAALARLADLPHAS